MSQFSNGSTRACTSRAPLAALALVLPIALASVSGCGVRIKDPDAIPYIDVIALADFADFEQDYGAAMVHADVDRDGHQELLIGSPASESTGAGLVLVLGLEGLNVLGALFPWSDADEEAGQHREFGRSLLVGDFNHDGWTDVVVGDPRANADDQTASGEAWYYAGPLDAAYYVRLTAETPTAGAGFGTTLTQGDFDGDGWLDFAVSAPGDAEHGGSGECVTVFFGPDVSRCETRSAGEAGTPFGVSLTALPPTADGGTNAQPLLAGAPQASDGDRAVGGAFAWDRDGAPRRLLPSHPGDAGFGSALELGAFSVRGTNELAVLAPDGGGALYLYDPAQLSSARRIALPPVFANRKGAPLRRFADVSRDGADELILLSATRDDAAGMLFSPGHGAAHLRFDFAAADAIIGNLDGDADDELLLSTPTSLTAGGSFSRLRMVDFRWKQTSSIAGKSLAPPLPIPGSSAHPQPFALR